MRIGSYIKLRLFVDPSGAAWTDGAKPDPLPGLGGALAPALTPPDNATADDDNGSDGDDNDDNDAEDGDDDKEEGDTTARGDDADGADDADDSAGAAAELCVP